MYSVSPSSEYHVIVSSSLSESRMLRYFSSGWTSFSEAVSVKSISPTEKSICFSLPVMVKLHTTALAGSSDFLSLGIIGDETASCLQSLSRADSLEVAITVDSVTASPCAAVAEAAIVADSAYRFPPGAITELSSADAPKPPIVIYAPKAMQRQAARPIILEKLRFRGT